MIEKVIPRLRRIETYVSPFSCKRHEYAVFKEITLRLNSQEHLTQEGLIKLVELASKSTFRWIWSTHTKEKVNRRNLRFGALNFSWAFGP